MATKSMTTRMQLRLMATYAAAFDLTSASDPLDQSYTQNLANGNADNQANRLYHDQHVINNTTYEWDLAAVTDVFGDVLGWDTLKGLLLFNNSTTSGDYAELVLHDEPPTYAVIEQVDLAVTAGTLTDETTLMPLLPGGIIFLWGPIDGWVIDGTHKNIGVTTVNSTKSVTVDIVAIGSV